MKEIKLTISIDAESFKKEIKDIVRELIEEKELSCILKNNIKVKEEADVDKIIKKISDSLKKNTSIRY